MKEQKMSIQFNNFSKSATKLEELFEINYENKFYTEEFRKELVIFKNDLFSDIAKIFHDMNVIVDSNIDRKNKINLLNSIRVNAKNSFLLLKMDIELNDITPDNSTIYFYKTMDKNPGIFELIFLKGLPLVFGMIDTKFKRSLRIIESQES